MRCQVAESFFQISGLGLFEDVFQAAVSFNFAFVQQNNAVADGFGFFQQMGGNDNGFIFCHADNKLADIIFLVGVKPVCRFVQKQKRRIAQNALRKADAALIAFRQRFYFLVYDIADIGNFCDAGHHVNRIGSRCR